MANVFLAILLVLFCCVVGDFSRIDVLNGQFDATGAEILIYNASRVLFLFFFLWILCGLGLLILEQLKKKKIEFDIGLFDEVILSFYLGGAVLTIAMFVLGFLNLYYKTTAVLVALPILAASYYPISRRFKLVHWPERVLISNFLETLMAGAFLLLAGHLLLSRCLYPGSATNDIYEHYLPYHKAVLHNHGIWPNDVWPNFYNAKGMGLTFFADLLTDLLASQTVAYCFLIVSALVLFSLTRRVLRNSLWAGLSAVAYLGCFLYSNEPGSGWGSFQAHHIQTSSWLIGTTWLASIPVLETNSLQTRKAWFWVCLLPVIATVIALPVFIAFTFSLFAGLTAWHWVRREKTMSHHYFLLGSGAIGTMVAIFILNQFASGWYSIDPLSTWRLADQKAFSEWCSPYLIEWFIKMQDSAVKLHWPSIFALNGAQWGRVLRLDVLKGLFPNFTIVLIAVLAMTIGIFLKFWKKIPQSVDYSLLVPSLAVCSGSVLLISEQYAPASTFRNLAFMAFFMAFAGAVIWKTAIDFVLTPFSARLTAIATGIFVSWATFVCVKDAVTRSTLMHHDLSTYSGFARGKISVHQAFSMGDGLLDYTLKAKEAVGIEAKVLFLNNDGNILGASYFAPGSGLLTEPSSTSFGGKWHIIALGPADLAIEELKKLGINYILMNLDADFMGAIPFGPLFEPEKMTQRFDLAWSDGSAFLLTWRGQGKSQLDQSVADRMLARRTAAAHKAWDQKDGMMFQLYDYIQHVYTNNAGQIPFTTGGTP